MPSMCVSCMYINVYVYVPVRCEKENEDECDAMNNSLFYLINRR